MPQLFRPLARGRHCLLDCFFAYFGVVLGLARFSFCCFLCNATLGVIVAQGRSLVKFCKKNIVEINGLRRPVRCFLAVARPLAF